MRASGGRWFDQPLAQKVPELTVYFWIVKVLTTGMGEATSDYFVHTYDPYLVVLLGAAALAIAVGWQLLMRSYNAWSYWLAVSMVAVFGTMAAGIVHVYMGVPYIFSASLYAGGTAAVFVAWYLSERTLSVHSIRTRRRELFYWAAVLATFAMGTAVGDMTAVTLRLGFFASGILFAILIVVPALAHRLAHLNEIVAFWWAYVLTRPLGASFADWIAVPASQGGLGVGKATVSIVSWLVIAALVAYIALRRVDAPDRRAAGATRRRRLPPARP